MKALDSSFASRFRALPFVTAVVAAGACVVYCHPAAQAALQYDRQAGGLSWLCRLFACHATHWTADHLCWDVAALLLLGALCEREGRRAFLACLLLSAVLIPLSLDLLQPQFTAYRGLSGIDSALFVLLAVSLITVVREPRTHKRVSACHPERSEGSVLSQGEEEILRCARCAQDDMQSPDRGRCATEGSFAAIGWHGRAVAAALLAAFLAKVVFEWVTGRNVFVASTAFVPVPAAHLVGAAVGAGVACGRCLRIRRHRRKSDLECQTLSRRIQPCTT